MGEIMATYGHIWPPSPQKVVFHAMNDSIEATKFLVGGFNLPL